MKILRFKPSLGMGYQRANLCLIALFMMGLGLFTFYKYTESRIVTFESRESKNFQGAAVLNQIKFKKQNGLDVWQMRQSHSMHNFSGMHNEFAKADFVEIALNNGLKTAEFRQLESGNFNDSRLEIEYSISCKPCHSNGPRLIRPNWKSKRASLSFLDKLTISLWNLKIKTYGQIDNVEKLIVNDKGNERVRSVPFSLKGEFWNAPLETKSCTRCHQSRSIRSQNRSWVPAFLRRNELTRQNYMSIRFLRNTHEMPPPLHTIEAEDQTQLDFFLGALPL